MVASITSFAERLKTSMTAWAMAHMDWFFAVARNLCPILLVRYKGSAYALVTRFADVQEVFQRPNVFDVIYAPKIRVLMDGGNIFLGMSDEEPETRDKATMRLTAPRWEAISRVRPAVEKIATETVAAASGRIDVAMALTQSVTTEFLCGYFGTSEGDFAGIADTARLLFKFMFVDLNNDPALRARVIPEAARMRAFVESKIVARKQARGFNDDMLERCLKLQDDGFPGTSDVEIRNNLIGMLVGGLPQPPMVVPQLIDVLLDRPDELAAAGAAARAGDDARLSKYVFEALRYYPLTPGLFRRAIQDYRLAGGTWRAKTIPAGTLVMAASRSAMFDGRRVSDPKTFRIDRPDYHYMHFGYGMHECFGVYINQAMLPAICKPLLARKNLRRAAGDAGKLQMDGAFARSLVVEFDA